jgi:TetR/AcrR family transcriptional regulator
VPSAEPRRRDERLRAFKRQLVIDAARRVFASRGLEEASMRLIAAEAGCTTGAIYPYFRGKEEIYAAILSESLRCLRQCIEQAMAGAPGPFEKVRASVRAFYAFYAERPLDLSLGLYLYRGLRPAGLSEEHDRSLNGQLLACRRLIAQAFDEAGFRDAKTEASAAIAHGVGLLVLEKTGRLRTFDASAEPLLERYLALLGAEGTSAAESRSV